MRAEMGNAERDVAPVDSLRRFARSTTCASTCAAICHKRCSPKRSARGDLLRPLLPLIVRKSLASDATVARSTVPLHRCLRPLSLEDAVFGLMTRQPIDGFSEVFIPLLGSWPALVAICCGHSCIIMHRDVLSCIASGIAHCALAWLASNQSKIMRWRDALQPHQLYPRIAYGPLVNKNSAV